MSALIEDQLESGITYIIVVWPVVPLDDEAAVGGRADGLIVDVAGLVVHVVPEGNDKVVCAGGTQSRVIGPQLPTGDIEERAAVVAHPQVGGSGTVEVEGKGQCDVALAIVAQTQCRAIGGI